MNKDTITAIATPLGESGIAVIRVSGDQAIETVARLYKGKAPLLRVPSHTIHYGFIVHPETREKIDEVLVTVMHGPRTFTAENVVEISCHGGIVLVQAILEALLQSGARLAEPGEFTKRAFLNGRIDLSQAEAVIDLIRSRTDKTAQLALKQMGGRLSVKIGELRNQIVETLAHLAVNVDYPEYDADEMTNDALLTSCRTIENEINRLLATARQGKIYREGLKTAIIGRPNVGKSSLMNALTQENKAIVTDIPGTTRDVIEEYVNVRGIPLRLLDTAGIRETADVVEKIGVERSYEVLEDAELILLLLTNAEPLKEGDRELLQRIKPKREVIVIVNKMDLPQRLDLDEVKSLIGDKPLITVSLKEEHGLDQIEDVISHLFYLGKVEAADATYVSNARHIDLLKKARQSIGETISAIEAGVPLDIAEIDMKNTWQLLGEVIGDAVAEDLIDQIFSQFCLGK